MRRCRPRPYGRTMATATSTDRATIERLAVAFHRCGWDAALRARHAAEAPMVRP